jgi:hypothetical protein
MCGTVSAANPMKIICKIALSKGSAFGICQNINIPATQLITVKKQASSTRVRTP